MTVEHNAEGRGVIVSAILLLAPGGGPEHRPGDCNLMPKAKLKKKNVKKPKVKRAKPAAPRNCYEFGVQTGRRPPVEA